MFASLHVDVLKALKSQYLKCNNEMIINNSVRGLSVAIKKRDNTTQPFVLKVQRFLSPCHSLE